MCVHACTAYASYDSFGFPLYVHGISARRRKKKEDLQASAVAVHNNIRTCANIPAGQINDKLKKRQSQWLGQSNTMPPSAIWLCLFFTFSVGQNVQSPIILLKISFGLYHLGYTPDFAHNESLQSCPFLRPLAAAIGPVIHKGYIATTVYNICCKR